MSSLKYNENLQCNIFTFEPSQCLTFSCQLKTVKSGNKNHLLFSPRSDLMNEKLISGLEQVTLVLSTIAEQVM